MNKLNIVLLILLFLCDWINFIFERDLLLSFRKGKKNGKERMSLRAFNNNIGEIERCLPRERSVIFARFRRAYYLHLCTMIPQYIIIAALIIMRNGIATSLCLALCSGVKLVYFIILRAHFDSNLKSIYHG